jgi:hypothetical protein
MIATSHWMVAMSLTSRAESSGSALGRDARSALSLSAVRRRTLILCAVLVVAVAASTVTYIGPRTVIGLLFHDTRREGDLVVGDRALDVTLADIDGRERRLAEFIGDVPLVLIFGSFT